MSGVCRILFVNKIKKAALSDGEKLPPMLSANFAYDAERSLFVTLTERVVLEYF